MNRPIAPHPRWTDRAAAGRELAQQLGSAVQQGSDTVVVALPRGGVAVAAEIARQLDLPLTPWAVRKLALPGNPEFAIGAIAPGDVVLWDPSACGDLAGHPDRRASLLSREQAELRRRQLVFGDVAPERLQGRRLIVVDDGIATGLTVRAALLSLARLRPQHLTLAVPVASDRALRDLSPLVNAVVVLAPVADLIAVGCHYSSFEQLSDADVLALLATCRRPPLGQVNPRCGK
ncbi:MAG: phosphoribosyltransferase family protein [Cyanobacteriota bacterium]|nr:phosphoribosyltransferase family protein [Cyanobacteriota bacterium]